MTTKQGDLSLLLDPVAQELLQSKILARLAYTWTDGTPRVPPTYFHWTGREIVFHTPPRSPKVRALRRNPNVALSIDTEGFPPRALLVRGTATLETMAELDADDIATLTRYLGDEVAAGWIAQFKAMLPHLGGNVRVGIRPEWVAILDFERRFPNAIEEAMAAMQAAVY